LEFATATEEGQPRSVFLLGEDAEGGRLLFDTEHGRGTRDPRDTLETSPATDR
jgi:hypothetical protein